MAQDGSSLILFPEYAPDVTPLGTAESQTIFNVVPRADGYGPFPDLETFTQALPADCRGYFFGRKSDGSIAIFAGTSIRLYLLDNTTFAWADVSKGGVAYGALVPGDHWEFAQYNDLVIAVQVNTLPQKYILSTGPTFIDLAGGPPQAGSIAIIGFFVVLTNLLSNPRRAHWSDLDAPETWSAGTGLCDFQDFPDGGNTLRVSGGDAYGLLFQEQTLRSMTYAPGNPAIFQFYRISTQEALFAKYSIVNIGNRVFYCSSAGFKQVIATSEPTFIGKEKVDRSFFADVDRANLQMVIGASDPTSTRIYIAYKSLSGNTGRFDKVLAYDYALNKWSRINMVGEYIASLAKPGLTLEGLDAIAPGGITVTGAIVSPTSPPLIRLTLSPGTTNGPFTVIGQNFIVVQGINPTYMNGTWRFNVIDTTHIDLVGSVFGAAYISGGRIGGSLDAMTISLDSISKASLVQLSAFGTTGLLGFFAGPSLEAIIETSEIDGEGRMLFTNGLKPITDAATAFCSIGYRNNASRPVQYWMEGQTDDMGQASFNEIESFYQRGRLRVPYGTSWSYARGLRPTSMLGGDR